MELRLAMNHSKQIETDHAYARRLAERGLWKDFYLYGFEDGKRGFPFQFSLRESADLPLKPIEEAYYRIGFYVGTKSEE